jgi:hypothetical protein
MQKPAWSWEPIECPAFFLNAELEDVCPESVLIQCEFFLITIPARQRPRDHVNSLAAFLIEKAELRLYSSMPFWYGTWLAGTKSMISNLSMSPWWTLLGMMVMLICIRGRKP